MTFGKKTLFSLLLGLELLGSVLELTHVNFLYTTTLILFCTYVLLPGFLISLILRIKKLSFWENFSFTIGLSIAFLELGGLFLNILLPLFGIKDPLSNQNIIYGFNVFLLLLLGFSWSRTKQLKFIIKLSKRSNLEKALYALPIFFPVLATLGAIVLNNGGSNMLTFTMLGAIAVYTFLLVLFRDKIAVDLYPYALFFMGVASLFTTSLRGWYITGHDVEKEFYVFQLTNTHHIWNMAFYQDAYNACLSITILPTVLTNLLLIPDMYIYKVIFQILFAISPVLVFFIIRNYTIPIFAFLSAFFYMAFPTFFNDMPMLNRQEIGFIFFGLVLYMMLLSELSLSMRKVLFVIFALGVLVSHYSTNFVLLALVLFVYVSTLIISLPFVKNTLAWLLSKSHLTVKNTYVNWYSSEDTLELPKADVSPKIRYPKMFLKLPQILRPGYSFQTHSPKMPLRLPQLPQHDHAPQVYSPKMPLRLPQLPQADHSPQVYSPKMSLRLPQLPQIDHSPQVYSPKMSLRLPQLPQTDHSPQTSSGQEWNDPVTWHANQNPAALSQVLRTDSSPKRLCEKAPQADSPDLLNQLESSVNNSLHTASNTNLRTDIPSSTWQGRVKALLKVTASWRKTHYRKMFLSLPLIVLLFAMTYFWNNLYTNSSGHTGSVIAEVINSLLVRSNSDAKSSDLSYSIFFATKQDPKQQLQDYISGIAQSQGSANQKKVDTSQFYSESITSKYPSYPLPQEQLVPTPLGSLLAALGIPVFSIQSELRSLSASLMQIFVFIGLIAAFFFKNEKPFDSQYLLLCFGGLFLLALITVLPALSVEYGVLRMFLQFLFMLSLPIVLALRPILFFVKNQKRILFTGIIAIFFFLNLTGLISHLTGDYYPQLTLDNAGLYYDAYYVHKSDVLAIIWLSRNNPKNELVESDLSGTNKLLTYGGIYSVNGIFPSVIRKNAYVYLEVSGHAIVSIDASTLIYNSSKPFLDDNKDLVYSNGKGNVYK